ncbi:hypothetical protein, partial [Nocardia brevicatena]|uniref:hypothetical protein n=1 Tax=Nocardia brevicatena TaxID=37327 RepID=UPI0005931F5C
MGFWCGFRWGFGLGVSADLSAEGVGCNASSGKHSGADESAFGITPLVVVAFAFAFASAALAFAFALAFALALAFTFALAF